MDIFRIKDGKIVEHWDVIQETPSEALMIIRCFREDIFNNCLIDSAL